MPAKVSYGIWFQCRFTRLDLKSERKNFGKSLGVRFWSAHFPTVKIPLRIVFQVVLSRDARIERLRS